MISKKIERKVKNDNHAQLANYTKDAKKNYTRHSEELNDNYNQAANYIIDQEHQSEKVLYSWYCNCEADDYDLAIKEVIATQELNTRSQKEKTYHLIISFRPEDEPKLNEAIFMDIEQEFAKGLGFAEHQRHCGVHKNTDNIHIHIAYNMIHPTKLTRHEPYRDFMIQNEIRKKLELKYNLSPDNNINRDAEPKRENSKIKTLEAHTGQQSFDSYVQERKTLILEIIEDVESWEKLQEQLYKLGLEYKLHGNGAIIKDKNGKHTIKASSVDRSLSKTSMEKKLGKFIGTPITNETEYDKFTAKPLQHEAQRGDLYKEYQVAIEKRKAELEIIKQVKLLNEDNIHKKWDIERKKVLNDKKLTHKDKIDLLRKFSSYERDNLNKERADLEIKRNKVRAEIPYWNWIKFLQYKAEQGNELALAILRSKKIEIEPEAVRMERSEKINPKSWPDWSTERRNIQNRNDLMQEDKIHLLALSRMHQAAEKIPQLKNFKSTIDTKGTILFTLPNGAMIRDSATELTYSAHDETAKNATMELAKLKFGKNYAIFGNKFVRIKEQKEMIKRQEISR